MADLLETTQSPGKKCAKCKTNPRTAKHPYCSKCKAEYQENFRRTVSLQTETAGFYKGCEAFRTMLVLEFQRLGGSMMTGFAVAEGIRNSPRPRLDLMVGALAAGVPVETKKPTGS